MTRSVVLIYPNAGQDVAGINVGLPLSVLYVGTALKKAGYDVRILDERVQTNLEPLLRDAIASNPLFIGISSMTGYQIRHGLAIARSVRDMNPLIPLVWGGVHPTIHPESTIQHELVDVVVVNEGESTAVELAQKLISGRDFRQVRGIVFKDSGRVVRTSEQPKADLERLPWPDFSLVDLNHYFTIGHLSCTKQLQIVSSRGCPFRCSYCYLLRPELRGYRAVSAKRLYDEIRHLQETYGIHSIFFYDDYFFGDRQRVVEFLELLEKEPIGVEFEVGCRVDFIARESDDFLSRLRKAGFSELLIGVESGSDRILGLIHKGFTRDQILCANRKLAKARIGSKLSWMAGFPTETREDFFQTIDLMLQLKDENPYCSLTPLGIYTPYPGTELYENCMKTFGAVFPETLEGWGSYQWQKNNNVFLERSDFRLLTKLNIASRFFDEKLFQRFGQARLRFLIMVLYRIYGSIVRLRVRKRFFRWMPEIFVLNWLQNCYIEFAQRRATVGAKQKPRITRIARI